MNKPVLLIGIGQFGCTVANLMADKLNSGNNSVHIMAIDTDERVLQIPTAANVISMAHSCDISTILDSLDLKLLKAWFPCDRENDYVEYFESLNMNEGANQWRMKALLSFYYYLSNPKKKAHFHSRIDDILKSCEKIHSIDVYIIASLAGGTGSGLFIPIDLYIKRYLRERGVENINSSAILAMPEITEEIFTGEQKIKARANTYAALCELNAMNKISNGEKLDVQIKIGDEEDPCFGLLYDSENEIFANNGKPFDKVYLFNRPYGVYSIHNITSILQDAISALLREEPISQFLQENDAIYGGIILSRAIYPIDSIVSYISTRTLFETASKEWLYLFKEASKQFKALRAVAFSQGRDFPEKGENLVPAFISAIASIYKSSELDMFSALLSRNFDNPSDDNAPDESTPDNYVDLILNTIDDEFENSSSEQLKELIAAKDDKSVENKQKALPFAKNKEQKENNLKLIKDSALLFAEYFDYCIESAKNGEEDFLNELLTGSSEISLKNSLLYNNGEAVNPVYALVCLCQVYNSLKTIADYEKSKSPVFDIYSYKKHKDEKNPSVISNIPSWIFIADEEPPYSCKYTKQGVSRLYTALKGDIKHIGSKQSDEAVICHDIKNAYEKIKKIFRVVRIKNTLTVLDKLIEGYYRLFGSIYKELDEISAECEFALKKHSLESRFTFYAGTTEGEKQFIYNCYTEYLKTTGETISLTSKLDREFGTLAYNLVYESLSEKEELDSQALLVTGDYLISKIGPFLEEEFKNSSFYRETVDKSILEVLLEQNYKHSGITRELALRKALLTNGFTIKYTLPENNEGYRVLRTMQNRVIAVLPREAENYISENSSLFDKKTPKRVMDELFAQAGESYGSADFRNGIPKNQMYVFRETMGLKLSFIEGMNEKTENPIYYKGYKKALFISREQNTELWNPHLVCTLKEDSLPLIYKE